MSGTNEPHGVDIVLHNPTPQEWADIAKDEAAVANTGTATTGGSTTPTVNYFPPDPTTAPPGPSPEGSKMINLNGKLGGVPYLIDSQGAIWQWQLDSSGNPVVSLPNPNNFPGSNLTINGMPISSGNWVTEMYMAQGQVYVTMDGGITGVFEITDNPQSGFAVKAIPPLWTTTGGGSTTPNLPAMPASPIAVSPAPGSTGQVVMYGPDATYKDPKAVLAANAVAAGGTIRATPAAAGQRLAVAFSPSIPVLIDGGGRVTGGGTATPSFSGGVIIDGSGLVDPTDYPFQQGGIVFTTDAKLIGFEVTGFGLQETGPQGTAAVRVTGKCIIDLEHLYLHDNQNGVFVGLAADITAFDLWLANNGLGYGTEHNWYSSAGVHLAWTRVTSIVPPIAASTTRKSGNAYGGHALKSYANVDALDTCWLASADASPVAFEMGTTQQFSIKASTLVKNTNDANHTLLTYGTASGAPNGYAGGTLDTVAFVSNCQSPFILTYGGTIAMTNCTRSGNAMTVQGGGVVTGMP